ncbi:putative diguanylate cyclase YdaM [Pirellulimonas nuda]|uniref:diguanylate cyclase n=1 Tax=Pirellulimonas nuda TaxID=2528009 RepID=A0A518D9W4_9BACT|nr:diguanylate cyclase [Pirellulimonas nuda]QDU88272.1 putative diguanylate cyclase YdaM [Pirellulimonas nuda]
MAVPPLDQLCLAAEASGLSAAPVCPSRGMPSVQGRLGMASALFTALRCKHTPTADHCYRVAVSCSTWGAALRMPEHLRDVLESAALLHDIGKIGVPDAVMLKPGRLNDDEYEIISRHPDLASHVLMAAGAPQGVIDTLLEMSQWFDGSNRPIDGRGAPPSVTARMLAIADAFDSMTTDHIYRPAKTRDAALAELLKHSGTQFDPDLVRSFTEHFAQDQSALREEVGRRWLSALTPHESPVGWHPEEAIVGPLNSDPTTARSAFEQSLIDNMHDGVIFVDSQLRITLWNTGMQRLAGVDPSAAIGQLLRPTLLDMAEASGRRMADDECPVTAAIRGGVQDIRRVSILGRSGKHVYVDLHVVPVRQPAGAAIMLRDVSSEQSLEARCLALHVEMTKDPMTQVANRAEFDRMLEQFIETHLASGLACSLVMADIDRFKLINDTHGHQAGDTAIIAFANLLKTLCRSGDLVARYGGEEFVVLCADCGLNAAARRAELMRKKLAAMVHECLGNQPFTASFGVTELQAGDTPETLIRRADRGLLMAKEQGRNQVVQLGGDAVEAKKAQGAWWTGFSFGRGAGATGERRSSGVVEVALVCDVPMNVAVEKLRGFISDHDAKIVKTGENRLRMTTQCASVDRSMRKGDKPIAFQIDLTLSETHTERCNTAGLAAGKYVQTVAEVQIRPRRDGDLRRAGAVERARLLLASLKSYLMAKEQTAQA